MDTLTKYLSVAAGSALGGMLRYFPGSTISARTLSATGPDTNFSSRRPKRRARATRRSATSATTNAGPPSDV